MPADFLPLADHSGLGRSLTAFVLDRALEEIGGAAARRASTSRVAVNLGPADLLDLGLPSDVDRRARAARLPGRPACGWRSPRTS